VRDYALRIMGKFLELEGEKVELCAELYMKNLAMLAITDERIEKARAAMLADGADAEEVEEFDGDEDLKLQRMEGGLFNVQQVLIFIITSCISLLISLRGLLQLLSFWVLEGLWTHSGGFSNTQRCLASSESCNTNPSVQLASSQLGGLLSH
jgi:hypothetical protein